MSGRLEVPGTVRIPLAVLVERRPGVTQWAEWSWRAVEVLEEAPELPPWTVLREAEGRTLFLAGQAEVELHPTDTTNYRDNLTAAAPSVWVVLRRGRRRRPAWCCTWSRSMPGRRMSTPMPATTCWRRCRCRPACARSTEAFVAEHHVERRFHKRRRDRADPEALARGGVRPDAEEEAG